MVIALRVRATQPASGGARRGPDAGAGIRAQLETASARRTAVAVAWILVMFVIPSIDSCAPSLSSVPPERSAVRGLVANEGADVDPGVGGADRLDAFQERELDHGPEADDVAAEELDQVDGAHRGGAGGDEIVDDQDALAPGHGVLVHLEVLDGVLVRGQDRSALAGQLALLADDGQAEAEVPGRGRGGEDAAGLEPGDDLRPSRRRPGRELVDGEVE